MKLHIKNNIILELDGIIAVENRRNELIRITYNNGITIDLLYNIDVFGIIYDQLHDNNSISDYTIFKNINCSSIPKWSRYTMTEDDLEDWECDCDDI